MRECVCWPHITALQRIQTNFLPMPNQRKIHGNICIGGCACVAAAVVDSLIYSYSHFLEFISGENINEAIEAVQLVSDTSLPTMSFICRTNEHASVAATFRLNLPELEPALVLVQPLSNCIQTVITSG